MSKFYFFFSSSTLLWCGAVWRELKVKEELTFIVFFRREYENELAKDNALDFDDLLLRGLELFTKFPRVIANVKQVLIDEVRFLNLSPLVEGLILTRLIQFQDTNSCQYDLVKTVARKCQCLCIVGDPDQSSKFSHSLSLSRSSSQETDSLSLHCSLRLAKCRGRELG